MLEIKRLPPPYRHLNIHVQEDQNRFVGSIEKILRGLKVGQSAFVIQFEQIDIGFFTLSPASDDEVEQLRSVNQCTLRSFMLDNRHQGRGYATQVLQQLEALTREHFPRSTGIGLTVNCENTHAYKLYEKNGFRTLEDFYLGGSAGPQYIMVLDFAD